jgi:hypothetical protein
MKSLNQLTTVILLAAIIIMGSLSVLADVGRGLHKKIYAVPVPGKVVIDGNLNDWDISGQIHSYVVAETAETQGAKIALMYDKDALYVSAIVRDNSPMMNRHDPKVDPEKAWDADVCQVWFSLDPDLPYPINNSTFSKTEKLPPVATMFLWYFTDRKEANLSIFRSMVNETLPIRPDLSANGVIPADHFKGAYKKADDGLGYTLEYRIPFDTMGLKRAPKANDLMATCFAVFWSTPDGLKTAGGAAWAYDVMGRPGFPFQDSGTWGKMSFSEKGNLPKTMVEEGMPPEKPLPLKFSYELPKDRQITIQLFDEKNNVARMLVPQQDRRGGKNTEAWDGLDDQGKPLSAGKYTWKGIQHDPIKWKVSFSVNNSGNPPWPTNDNKGGWGGDHGTPSTVCTVPGGMVLAWNGCEYGWGIIKVDLNGKKIWGTKHAAEHLATNGKQLYIAGDHGFNELGVQVLDLVDSRPTTFGNNKPSLIAPDGGTKETDKVTGLAYNAGKIYVSYEKRDLIAIFSADKGELQATWPVSAPRRISVQPDGSFVVLSKDTILQVKDGKTKTIIETGLDNTTGISVGTDGTIYVSNSGKSQDIDAFDVTGKLLRHLGRPGGRPAAGKYDPEGIYMPGGISIDEQNRLWVAETQDGPKRISVWDTLTGKNLAEYFGGSSYFGYGYIDPDKPSEILAHNVLWAIDWKKLKGTPTTTIWRKTNPDMAEEPNPDGYQGLCKIFTANDGKQYMTGGGHFKRLMYRRDGDVFKPFLAVIGVYDSILYGGQGSPLLSDKKTFPNGYYLWQDENNDQIYQKEEVKTLPKGIWGLNMAWVDNDLTINFSTGHQLKVDGKTEGGWPHYDAAKFASTPLVGKVGGYFWRDQEGFSYSSANNLVKWNDKGEALWRYNGIVGWHYALNMPMVGPGKLHGMTGPMGTAGDYFAMMTYFGCNHIFTRDGIYVAAILGDGRLGGRGADEGQPEGQGGQFVKLHPDPNGPERYFIIHGGQDSRVWEVFGLDSIEPITGGVYEITPEDAAMAKAKFDEYNASIARSKKLTIARGRTALDMAEPVSKAVDNNRRFEARAAYDDNNLYIKFDITSPNQLINAETESKYLFHSGNCLDIQIATDPNADEKRKKPAVGDLRILITRQANKPYAVLYRPKVADFKGEPIILKSPTGTESFDSIEVINTFTLDYKKGTNGFTATVTLPLTTINWKPLPGKTIKMDLGYLFGNDMGTQCAARAYWMNNGFSANVTNDIPNESRLEPAEWGTALVE